ncbi:MAG TPA: VCBS repeat-containing protein, partial [Myxococcales bacterium]|nr:VCBS repeat-containing protein [Myxococcales bacterium]HIK86156.1 VCBS repeat-containing protein [Myxococcales bacterium]
MTNRSNGKRALKEPRPHRRMAALSIRALVIALLLSAAGEAGAQQGELDPDGDGIPSFGPPRGRFEESQVLTTRAFSRNMFSVKTTELDDVDGDGDVDLHAFATDSQGSRTYDLFLNQGDGTFSSSPIALDRVDRVILSRWPGDVNGDGLGDLLVGSGVFFGELNNEAVTEANPSGYGLSADVSVPILIGSNAFAPEIADYDDLSPASFVDFNGNGRR